jgi:carboxylesterase type B
MKHTNIAESFISFLQSSLPAKASSKLLSLYPITPDLPDPEALSLVLDIFSSVLFYCPAIIYSKAFLGKSYLLHFDAKNLFPGPLQGRASHILDVAYLFQNYNEHLSPEDKKVAEMYAEKIILFVNGMEPWRKYDGKGTAFVLDGKSGSGEKEIEEYDGRKKGIWEVVDMVGGDKLVSVLFGYLASAH